MIIESKDQGYHQEYLSDFLVGGELVTFSVWLFDPWCGEPTDEKQNMT